MALSKGEQQRMKKMTRDELNRAIPAVATALFHKRQGTKSWKESKEYLTALQAERKSRMQDEIDFIKSEIKLLDPINDFCEIRNMLDSIKKLKKYM